MIWAFGQISEQRRESDVRSSSVPQPARKIPARSISFGSWEKIARKTLWGSEAEIRWRKFSLLDNSQVSILPFDQNPGGFGSATFDAKDALH